MPALKCPCQQHKGGAFFLEQGQLWFGCQVGPSWVASGKAHMAELTTAAFSLTWGYFNDRERVKENLPLSPSDHFQHQAEPIEYPYGTFWRAVSQLVVRLKQSFKLMRLHTQTHSSPRAYAFSSTQTHQKRKNNNIPLNVWKKWSCLPHASTRAKPH